MNPILNDDSQQSQRMRTIPRVATEALCGIAIGILCELAFASHLFFPYLNKTVDLVSSLIAIALIVIILRWIPFSPLRTKPVGQTRRRIAVLSYLGGWLGVFLTLEAHSVQVPIPGYLLACLGIAGLSLALFVGSPVLFFSAESGRLGSLWSRPAGRMDERELQLRQRAFALTCRILIVAILLAGFLLTWIDLHNLLPTTRGGPSPLLPLLILFHLGVAGMGLPSAIIAWNEPDAAKTDL